VSDWDGGGPVASYVDLGTPGPNAAGPDQTGRNPGNLTNALTSSFINIYIAVYECYHMTVNSVPLGAAAVIIRNSRQYSFTQPFTGSEWDPAQPMGLFAGDEIDFLWNVPSSTTPVPVVTAFFRYDADLPQNKTG
jgi:hypothetical protein